MLEKFIKFKFIIYFPSFFLAFHFPFYFLSFLLSPELSKIQKEPLFFLLFFFCFFPKFPFTDIYPLLQATDDKPTSFFLFLDNLHELTNNVGEAVYVDDIPSPTNCLHGAFIYSTKPFAQVKGIKLRPKSVGDGVSALISFKDIPGENIGTKNRFGTEPFYLLMISLDVPDSILLLW